MITQYGNISLGDTVDEYLPYGNGQMVYYRTFVVTSIERHRDMDGNIVTMIGDDEEACSFNNVQRVPNP